jgi:hypothetical protein
MLYTNEISEFSDGYFRSSYVLTALTEKYSHYLRKGYVVRNVLLGPSTQLTAAVYCIRNIRLQTVDISLFPLSICCVIKKSSILQKQIIITYTDI